MLGLTDNEHVQPFPKDSKFFSLQAENVEDIKLNPQQNFNFFQHYLHTSSTNLSVQSNPR